VIGSLKPTGLRPTFLSKFEKHGVTLPVSLFADNRANMADVPRIVGR
jgi:hypothetical protein